MLGRRMIPLNPAVVAGFVVGKMSMGRAVPATTARP